VHALTVVVVTLSISQKKTSINRSP